ncbi:MAG: S-adenosylhomocysteine deaminase [Bacteroidetes bacterium]|nr:MAG: S-adenosylhomocysteine deaminase [Bacteroidota bacterium]
MKKLAADFLFTDEGIVQNQVLILDDTAKVLAIELLDQHDPGSVEYHAGLLVPGLVNAHCHLELSHMKGKVATGTRLIPFITNVVKFRDVPEQEVLAAITAADQEMFEAGIVAVGDICNRLDTAVCKAQSPIRYYSFVEMFDFLQDAAAEKTVQDYLPIYEQQAQHDGNRRSAVPHAPYSVSKSLFARINQLNQGKGSVSIHNQETPPENELFVSKTGDFVAFYRDFGISLEEFSATGQSAIHYALAHMDPACRTLFVHNTTTTAADIAAAQQWGQNGIYWVSCPNANLYIENRLPNYQLFLDANAKVALGTDSLTSNWQLSILEEMKTIQRYQSYVPFAEILKWATSNGAEALQYEQELGSFSVGKRPGVNLITGLAGKQVDELRLQAESTIRRLV